MEDTQFDFLKLYIEKTLDEAGFDKMTEETRAQYVPQFVAEAERRIGLALMPRLPGEAAMELEQLLGKEDINPEEMQQFWKKYVPDFDEVLQKTLTDFAEELKEVVAQIS
ncbi:MAG: hypothetical protein HYV41_04730 [Candidatus Magasanikbacteria bacterium]|nr:hypothetical protein [Candidatus Magasanikbacteria bacterium]